jgi:hypothetical protein
MKDLTGFLAAKIAGRNVVVRENDDGTVTIAPDNSKGVFNYGLPLDRYIKKINSETEYVVITNNEYSITVISKSTEVGKSLVELHKTIATINTPEDLYNVLYGE